MSTIHSPLLHRPDPAPAVSRSGGNGGARSVDEALELAVQLGGDAARPGDGTTAAQWDRLSSIAAEDLGMARAIEPHLDAVAILLEAGRDDVVGDGGTFGVFASEGPASTLRASIDGKRWVLTGTKPWCSLAGRLDSALVTAADSEGERRLFAVSLRRPDVEVLPGTWHARGLVEIPSGPVQFTSVDAEPIGDTGWYLSRPGFSYGGIGVAACWFGGAVGLARTLFAAARKTEPSPFTLMHLGAVDTALQNCRRSIVEAARLVDAGEATGGDGRLLAKRVRSTVAAACEDVITRVGHALGPAPLALDDAHAKRVADLQLYLRQHHAERDDLSLGETLARQDYAPW